LELGQAMQEQKKSYQQLVDELDAQRQRIADLQATSARLWSIYDAISLIVIAHDTDYRVVYMNPHACHVLGYERDEMIGQPIGTMLHELGEAERAGDLMRELKRDPSATFHGFEQYYRKRDGGVVLIRWDISGLQDAEGNYAGIVGVGQDITGRQHTEQEAQRHRQHLEDLVAQREDRLVEINEQLHWEIRERKRVEQEREKLIAELQDALDQVQTLRGLVPICASCKKIRDDHGFWHQVEVYVRDHSLAEFSHSICPDCMEKLYPGYELGDDPKGGS
jgi:PAS domain S-box-containing protein